MSYNPGDVLKEKYVIKEVLGQGSMGEVYRAEHVTIHRQFAIKLMHVHIAERADSLARFRREASAAALLEHPHICQVTDFDSTENGDFYLVMEYLKGETLRDRLKRNGTIELHSVFRIMDDLLCALECAHSSGIVHRDVKPENISLINRDDRDDYVKLIDFGIAHADKPDDNNGTLTQAGQVYGTPQYLSPEQVMGEHVDFHADLYSCGCMLYEMIEGAPPFDGNNYVLLLNKHLVLDPPHLTKEFECSGDLDAVIQKLLMKHPEERFGSAREVRVVLSEIAHRFDPSLNLYMSQNGGTSPSLSSSSSPSNLKSSLGSNSINGMASISNPYVNPDEIGLLDSLNGRTSAPQTTETAKAPENDGKKEGDASKKKELIIIVAVGVIIIIVAFVLFYLSLANKASMYEQQVAEQAVPAEPVVPAPQAVPEPPKQEVEQPKDKRVIDINDTEVISELDPSGFILSDEQLREYAKAECHISESDPLYQDEALRAAVDQCAKGEFEEAYQVFDHSKNKYKGSKRFFIMSLIESYAIKRYRDAIRDALQLVIIDPAAVCTPAVRDIIYSLYEDDVTYIRLRTGFLNHFDQPGTAEGLSWLLLMTPCNQYQKRFEHLSDSIKVSTKSFEEEYDETWLGMAVHLWDNFDPKSKCSIGKKVDKIVLDELDKECRDAEGAAADSGRCAMCYPIWKERKARK